MNTSEKIAIVSVSVVLGKFILSGVIWKLGSLSMNFGTVDASSMACILTPVLGALHLGSYIDNQKNSNDKT